MKKNPHICSVCFNLDDRVKKDMQEALSKTPYSMARAFQIFAKMCGHAKNGPKSIADFLFENNYDDEEDLKRIDEDIKNGTANTMMINRTIK